MAKVKAKKYQVTLTITDNGFWDISGEKMTFYPKKEIRDSIYSYDLDVTISNLKVTEV